MSSNFFNEHKSLSGQHAFLSPSKYSWIRYDLDKLQDVYLNHLNVETGVKLHEIAKELILNKIQLPKKQLTFNVFVNDAIGFKMIPEQVLYYSDNCFGTADAISFNKNKLRIHDLKTGVIKASIEQLLIYASLFCLEYRVDPNSIEIELRIYQNNDIVIVDPEKEHIKSIMDTIIIFDKRIKTINGE